MRCMKTAGTNRRGSGTRAALAALLFAVLMILTVLPARAQVGYQNQYSYTYDYWGDVRYAPDAYRVRAVMNSSSLGLDISMAAPGSLFVKGDQIGRAHV